ncbi:phosphoribosylanthranilate isomerase [Paenibacillus urinalis]|uniref:phosphoribosylanthranilate isomerase n=1 Tax=Paenibacillus urinalis TaxID=521520 RepID=UPI00195FBC24
MTVQKAKPLLKICGLQDVEVLKSMKHLTVDFIGFVFAKSRRQVSAEQAAQLCNVLNEWEAVPSPRSAGVFVNPDWEELTAVLDQAPLDVIQLHGQESPDFCQKVREVFGVQVFKAFSIHDNQIPGISALEQLNPYKGKVDAILLDTYDGVYGGGSGKTFAWEKSLPYQQWADRAGIPLFVAGGLDAENVNELVNRYAPDGIDVSSGVETDGHKDIVKMTAFVERVKKA